MALACPIPEHPVGDGAFCRICGRTYVTVAAPVHAETQLPEPTFKHESAPELLDSPFAELHEPSMSPPPPADPVLDTGLIDTRFAELTAPEAPLGDLATVSEAAPDEPSAKTPRAVPPAVLHALAGAGGGALVMALLDRFVL